MAVHVASSDVERPALVAPLRHTALLALLFVALALGGALVQGRAAGRPDLAAGHPHVASLYLGLIAMEWGLVLYVRAGTRRRPGGSVRELIGGRWTGARDVAVDAALAAALWGTWMLVTRGWERVFAADHAA